MSGPLGDLALGAAGRLGAGRPLTAHSKCIDPAGAREPAPPAAPAPRLCPPAGLPAPCFPPFLPVPVRPSLPPPCPPPWPRPPRGRGRRGGSPCPSPPRCGLSDPGPQVRPTAAPCLSLRVPRPSPAPGCALQPSQASLLAPRELLPVTSLGTGLLVLGVHLPSFVPALVCAATFHALVPQPSPEP